jgi:Propeller.
MVFTGSYKKWQFLSFHLNVADKTSNSNGASQNNNNVGFRHVSAGPVQGEIWAITATGVVCRRHGITPDNPAGTGWSHGIGVRKQN